MRFLLPLVLVFASLAFTSSAQRLYVAGLAGHQEVPSATTLASGIIEMNLDGDTLRVSGNIASLSSPVDTSIAGGAHIHLGYAGENGPLELPLEIRFNSSDFSAEFPNSAYFVGGNTDLLAALSTGRAYVNVHTFNFPGGEVRGQIVDVTQEDIEDVFDAMLYGDQQNPQVLTDGMGGVMIEVKSDSLIVTGAFSLESPLNPVGGTGVHLHLGLHGQNGGVALALEPTMAAGDLAGRFTRANNSFLLDATLAQLIDEIYARNVYVNIHSAAHPSGELRGQVVGYNSNLYFGHVTDNALSPYPNHTVSMRFMTEKLFDEDSVTVSGYIRNMPPTIAFSGAPVVAMRNPFTGAGLVEFDLPSTLDANGNGPIPIAGFGVDQEAVIGQYLRYLTLVGWSNSDGSSVFLSSPLYHECKRVFETQFSGSQSVPNSPSLGNGFMLTEYYTNRIELTGFVGSLSGAVDVDVAGGFHIHSGMPGQTGGIVQGVNFLQQPAFAAILPDRNLYSLGPDDAIAMRDRGLYYNVHTAAFPSGEVRGQIVPKANAYYHSILSAGQAIPGYGPSTANGALIAEVYENTMAISGSFNNLVGGFDPSIGGTGAHLHAGLPGRTGPVVVPLGSFAPVGGSEGVFFASDNTFALSPGLADTIARRGIYANIHTTDRPAGELRGLFGPIANTVYSSNLNTALTVPFTGTLGGQDDAGQLVGTLHGDQFVVAGSFNNLSSPIDTAIAGGAHMHQNVVGETGPIAFGLNVSLGAGSTSALIEPTLNTRPIDASIFAQLNAGELYANVHTADAPSGGIRGQMLLEGNQFPEASAGFSFPMNGAMVDLNSADSSTIATIDWEDASDPDPEHGVGYIWQLYTDTTMAPVFQTTASGASELSLSFGTIDGLLASLGVAEGQSATVYHRAWTTDGSLLTPGAFAEVTFTRILFTAVAELPAESVRLMNSVLSAGGELSLEVAELPAGRLQATIVDLNGKVLKSSILDHTGFTQQYILDTPSLGSGMYVLHLQDEDGRGSSWLFYAN